MHGLALCSRVLYDKQVLDDRKRIASLEKEVETWKQKCAVATLQGTRLYQSMHDNTIQCILHMLYHTNLHGTTLLDELMQACDVSYTVSDHRTAQPTDEHVDIRIHMNDEEASLILGGRFWTRKTLTEQLPVYYFLYVLSMLDYFEFEDLYHVAWDITDTYSPGTFFYVLNMCEETRRGLSPEEMFIMIH